MFKMVLFDVDGVILSEERYFDASALTVHELLNSPQYLQGKDPFAAAPEEEEIRRIRRDVFAGDEVLSFMKSRGINANWDMVFLQFSYQLIRALSVLKTNHMDLVKEIAEQGITRETLRRVGERLSRTNFQPDYAAFVRAYHDVPVQKHELLLYLNTLFEQATGVQTKLFSRNSSLWTICQETFQEWYIGDDWFTKTTGQAPRQKGKRGFLKDEIALVKPEAFLQMLTAMRERGIELGMATGRPSLETREPLKELGVLAPFNEKRITTASDVLQAEEQFPERAPLSKPRPFQYLRSYLGADTPLPDIFSYPLPLQDGQEVLIVGDSVADLLAARALGVRFAATLTGLKGEAARPEFEELGADYILRDALAVQEIIEQ